MMRPGFPVSALPARGAAIGRPSEGVQCTQETTTPQVGLSMFLEAFGQTLLYRLVIS